MFKISESVPLPSEVTQEKIKKQRKVRQVIQNFQNAYCAIYFRRPEVSYQEPWFRIDTQKARVNINRLVEMTKNLQDRAP